MDKKEILSKIDHTILSPDATVEEVEKVCSESVAYRTASACIPPCYVKEMSDKFGDSLIIATVVGFPLGYMSTAVKVEEARQAVEDGAQEIDMVISISALKNQNFEYVLKEIQQIKSVIGENILKVIVETSFLTKDEKIKVCEIVSDSGADFIKTSTGFSESGAKIEDIRLFKKYLDKKVKIKASGGIRTAEEFEAFILAGADRIGASSGVKVLGSV